MIEVKDIAKKFGDKTVLKDVNLEIKDGSVFGLVGTNGAGKSTLLRLLTGIYEADEGEIKYDGEPVFDNEKVKEGIVIVPDELYFLPNSNLKRMAKFYESYYKSFSRKRFDALVETFRFDKEKTLSKMSKGMKRQAAMILALSVRPKYLFFDETFDGLDPMVRQAFKQIIIKDVEDNNTTVIFTSHSLRELEGVCDTLAFINNDTVVFHGDIISIQNSMFKIQVAFKEEFDKDTFEGIEILDFEKNGSVANMIVKGDREEVEQKIKAMNPMLFDVVMLNLEEIFNYQVGASGYSFDMSLLEEE